MAEPPANQGPIQLITVNRPSNDFLRRRMHPRRERTIQNYPKPPKRPLSTFSIYVRFYLRQYNRTMRRLRDGRAVMAALRKEFRNMPGSHRRYFGNLSQETKTRYKKELELWKTQFRAMGRKKIPRIRKRPKQDPTLPRRPMTPYMHFFKEKMSAYRTKHPRHKYIDIVKDLGKQWKGLWAREKVPYVERARASLHEYNETMKQWKLEKRQSKNLLRIEKKAARLKLLREKYMKKVENVDSGRPNDATIAAVEEKRLGDK